VPYGEKREGKTAARERKEEGLSLLDNSKRKNKGSLPMSKRTFRSERL